MRLTANQINELMIKLNHRLFGFCVASLELNYTIFKAVEPVNEFAKVAGGHNGDNK